MSEQKLIRICDKVIEFCFYSLLIAVTFSISIVEIAASLMICAWLVKKIADRDFRFIKQTPFILMVAFFLWNVLSCFNSDYGKESFRGILKIAEYLMLFLIAATHRWKGETVKRAIIIIAVVAIIICASGIFQGTGS